MAEYDLQSMLHAAASMQHADGLIRGDVAKLTGLVNDVEAQWRGAASQEMTKTMADWKQAQENLLGAFKNIQQLMRDSLNTLGVMEDDQRKLMQVPVSNFHYKF